MGRENKKPLQGAFFVFLLVEKEMLRDRIQALSFPNKCYF